jgi:hypothetical protein
LVTFYIQVMQMILHVRVRVRRVFPGRLGRFKSVGTTFTYR